MVSVVSGSVSVVADQRVDHHHPAGLGGRHRDDQRVEQAVAVVADPVALEGGHRAGQHGVGEQAWGVGVRRAVRPGQGDGVAHAEQGDTGSQQPAREAVLGVGAVCDEDDCQGRQDGEDGPQAARGQRWKA